MQKTFKFSLWCVVVAVCFAVLTNGSQVSGQVFARSDDLRPKVPERWPEVTKYTLDLSLGGSALSGNIETRNIGGGLSLKYLVDEKREVLVEGKTTRGKFSGNVIQDKQKGSFLYIYKWKPGINLYFSSTFAKDSGTRLDSRITYGLPGICWHQLLADRFDLFLVSLHPTFESETFETGVKDSATRATLRINFENAISETATLGGDFMYIPDVSDFGDYRFYIEPYLRLSIVPQKYSFKITYAREHDSRPLPGVEENDYGIMGSFVYHLQE